ncbi:RNA recognition motif (RRM, RBD, or RNP domain), partial [Rhizoctonia solani]
MSGRKILFVSGFSRDARAKDLAYEFERYGRLVRCDIPSTRGGGGASRYGCPVRYRFAYWPLRTIRTLLFDTQTVPISSNLLRAPLYDRRFDSFDPGRACDAWLEHIALETKARVEGDPPYAFVEFRNDRDAEDAYHSMHGQMIDRHRISWARRPPSALWRHDAPRPRGGRDRRDDRDRDRDRRDRDRSRSRSPRRDDKDKDRDRDTRRRSRTRSRSRDRRDRERDEERDEPRTREDRDDVDEREDRHRRSLSREPNGVVPVKTEPDNIKKEPEPVAEEDK